jgi:hypothetical protein
VESLGVSRSLLGMGLGDNRFSWQWHRHGDRWVSIRAVQPINLVFSGFRRALDGKGGLAENALYFGSDLVVMCFHARARKARVEKLVRPTIAVLRIAINGVNWQGRVGVIALESVHIERG